MPYKIPWRPTEPAREAIYRKLYVRIGVQDDCISWLLTELRALQKRVNELEEWRARSATENTSLGEPISRLDQSTDLHQE